ncbi:MAG TPA: glutathione S-transferase family protein [Solirubrobacterales bacterium]|jgi:glutathione S-transferase|nr:glutathione S-transferase family protein [Solirubrobacterales bacterium]
MGALPGDSRPVLWQIEISHYSEKVRWALEYEGIDHVRRSPFPGMHIPIALWLSGGEAKTFPILQVDGRTITDSTAAIAALEELVPQPDLYPTDPEQRHRALALEDYFDEELGPHARLLPFHELLGDPDLFAELAAQSVPGPLANAKGFVGAYARGYTRVRWGAGSDEAAAAARAGIVAAMDRLEAELESNGGEYLVGDGFSVADLTAAALFYPIVVPEGGPLPPGQPMPASFERFRESLGDRRGFVWVEETFRRHRRARPAASASL